MKTELEVKVLEINPDRMKRKLHKIGAKKVGESIQRRYVYDVKPKKENVWIRLRDNGQQATLTIKEIRNDSIKGTKEIETEVGSFEDANKLLNYLGFKDRAYQENRRISYKLGSAEIEIDIWPKIPPYMEIEAPSENVIKNVLGKLGYSITDTTSENTEKVYSRYGKNIHDYKRLKLQSV